MRETRKLIYERYFDLFIWRKLGVENLGNIRFIYTKKKRIFFYFELDNYRIIYLPNFS